jgi:KTSC domain-containing protein
VYWLSVESSVLAAVAYHRDRRHLYLRFCSGDVYRYFRFPPHQYDELLAAESKGRYFAYNIRDKFPYEQVHKSPLSGATAYSSGE